MFLDRVDKQAGFRFRPQQPDQHKEPQQAGSPARCASSQQVKVNMWSPEVNFLSASSRDRFTYRIDVPSGSDARARIGGIERKISDIVKTESVSREETPAARERQQQRTGH
ncbi:uncharacterized protein V6R79_018065 [Siganus canaliculatus]